MVTKKTIAEIRRSFAQFFADADIHVPRSRYVWTDPNSNLDDDATLRNDTSTVINPLNELKFVDCFQTKVSHKSQKDKIHLPVDRRKENEKSVNVYGMKKPAAVQESVIPTAKRRKLSRRDDNEADATIGNLIHDFQSSEKCADIEDGQPFNSAGKSVVINETTANLIETSEEVDDYENESTVSDQLNAFIKIYEQKEPTIDTIKEIEWIIGKPGAQPIIEAAEPSVDVDRQQLSESHDCIPKRHKNKTSHNLKDVVDWQPLVKLHRLRKNPKSQKPLSTSKKKKSAPKLQSDCNEKNNSKNVIESFAQSNTIQPTLAGDRKLIESAPATPMHLIEQKTLSVSEWIRESSQVQPDNNADDIGMNEFLQDVDLPILSDIEDDAFQLARYIEQSLNESQKTSSVNTIATQLPEQASHDDENGASKPLDLWNGRSQPLDLTVKQTPMSTDTGFCNDSFLLDATPPYRCCGTDGIEPVYANHTADNWNLGTNAWMNGSQKYAVMENAPRIRGNVDIFSAGPSTSSVIIPSTFRNNETESSTPVDLSQTSKQRHIADPIIAVAAEIERPTMQGSYLQTHSQPTDWTMDNCSTDLDFEPSEDEDDIKFLNQLQQTGDHQPPKTRNSFTIQIANNSSTSRVVFETTSMHSQPFKSPSVNIVEPLAHQHLPFHAMRPDAETINRLIKQQMVYLFKGLCFSYLKGVKCTAADCKFNHKLPASQEILKKLHLFSNDTIWGVYTNWIVKYQHIFDNYFPTICDVFRSRNMQTELLASVKHCERRNKMSYYLHIYSSLIMMNVSKLEALTKIGDNCCKTKMACTVLMNVMAEDPLYFIELLQKYYRHAYIRTHHMLSMLRKIIKNPTPAVLALFVDIFEKYSLSDVCDIGEYRAIFSETKRLVVDDIDLHQKLYQIALRDKRIDF